MTQPVDGGPDPLPTPEQIAERRDAAITAAGMAFARGLVAQAQMTAREQAEAAYTPTGPSVDELEDRIRADRGLPPLDRSKPKNPIEDDGGDAGA